MATGDILNLYQRLKENLPPWFGNNSPNLDALMLGLATTDNYIYQLIQDAQLQTRIHTATGMYLDLASLDFFGGKLPRRPNENDDSYRNRILANLFQERATRHAEYIGLLKLTGRAPLIYESFEDGAYLDQTAYLDNSTYGFDEAYTGYIIAFRPSPINSMLVYGMDNNAYLDVTAYAYDPSDFTIIVSDADIYALVDSIKCAGTLVWVHISD
jgi:hypothetical protein